MYKVVLETTDVDDRDFRKYLTKAGITSRKVSEAAPIAGAGEGIEYSSASCPALVGLIYEYFDCGDDSVTQEMVGSIANG